MKNIESIKDIVNAIDVFKIKNNQELILLHEALKQFGLKAFSDDTSKQKFENSDTVINNNFLFKEPNGSWRLQSHYLGNGFPVSEFLLLTKAFEGLLETTTIDVESDKEAIMEMIEESLPIDLDLVREYNNKLSLISKK